MTAHFEDGQRMSFEITNEQVLLRDAVAAYLDKQTAQQARPGSQWRALANDIGLSGVSMPAEFGGLGGGAVEVGIVMREFGRACTLEPFVESVVLGKSVKEMDLTEKMAFFEAYGSIAGVGGLKALSGMLLPRGLLKLKESSETRACAAIAIGKVRTPEARDILTQVVDDKDLVVRNAVSRALREGAR